MARSSRNLSHKTQPARTLSAPAEWREPSDREVWPAGFDPSYGESLAQLLPRRLSDLVLRR